MSIQIEVEGKKYQLLLDSESGTDDGCMGCAFHIFEKCNAPRPETGMCITEEGIWKEVENG